MIVTTTCTTSSSTGPLTVDGALAQWYSQCTSALEVAGSIPTHVIVELL